MTTAVVFTPMPKRPHRGAVGTQHGGTTVVDVGSLYPQAPASTLNTTGSGNQKQQATVAGLNSLIPVIYGRRKIGAKIVGAIAYGPVLTPQSLYLICLWGHGTVDAVETVYINDEAVPAGVTVTNYTGTQTTPHAALVTAYASYGKVFADTYAGYAYSVVVVPANLISGFPRVSAIVRGQKVRQVQNGFVTFNGTTSVMTTPNAALNTVDADFEAIVGISATDYTPTGEQVLLSKWTTTGNQRSWQIGLAVTTGKVFLNVSTNGSSTTQTFTSVNAPGSYVADAALVYLRVRFTKTNGANSVAKFDYSLDGHYWQSLGADQTATVVTALHASTGNLRIGSNSAGSFFAGKFHTARVVSSVAEVLKIQAFDVAQSATTHTDEAGVPWTFTNCTGNASIVAYSQVPINQLVDFATNSTYGADGVIDWPTAYATYQWNAETVGAGMDAQARHLNDLLVDSSQPIPTWLTTLRDAAHCWVVKEGERFYFPPDKPTSVFSSGLPVALDATTTSISTGYDGGPYNVTWSHTCTGSDRLLVVSAAIWQDTAPSGTITSLTYNGVALTRVTVAAAGGSNITADLWYLVNPASGSNTIALTVTGATLGRKFVSSSYTGISQTSPLGAFNTAATSGGHPTASLTTLVDNSLVVGILSRFSTDNATPNTFINLANERATSTLMSGEYLLTTTAGLYTNAYTGTSGNDWGIVLAEFERASYTFDQTTIEENSLQIKKRGSRNSATAVEITYTEIPTSGPWRDGTVTVYQDGVLAGTVPRRMSKVSKTGITRFAEANRYAIERLNDSITTDLEITFNSFDESAFVRVGDLIAVTHPIGFTAKPFRVLKVDPTSAGRRRFTCMEYDPLLYSATVAAGPSIIDTTLPSPSNPPAVTGLVATEDLVKTFDGLYISRIRLVWDATTFPFVQHYRIEIFEGNISGTLVHTADVSSSPFVTPSLKEQVLYTARVKVISTTGIAGSSATTTLTPLGKFLPPGNVPTFAGYEAGGQVHLSWGVAVDLSLDTIRYVVKQGSTTQTWDTAAQLDIVSALNYRTPGLAQGTYRFFIKAIDSVGNYSTTASSVDVVVTLDNAAFTAYSYLNQTVDTLAMTTNMIGANRIATTDFGDAMGYGHATLLNTADDWDDGTVAGSVVGMQPHRQALRFRSLNGDTLDRYVAVPYVAAQNVGTSFYLEAWVYPLTNDATARSVFSQRTANDAGGWDLRIAGGKLYVAGTSQIALSNETIPLNQWTHVAVKVSASVASLYINGTVCTYSIGPNAYTYLNNTGPRWIGAIRTGAIFAFDGLILRTKLWNTALSDANRLISMQYDNDATAIGGMVGCWKGADQAETATSTVYADSGTGASNGVVTSTVEWKSWSEVVTDAVDLGSATNATFTISGGDPTAYSGTVGPLIMLSSDDITYTTYRQSAVASAARYFKFGYEAQGGSMSVNLTTMLGQALVAPKTELQTVAALSGSAVTCVLKGLYATCIDLQTTYAGTTTGTPNNWTPTVDQIEVSAKGIAGGVYASRVGTSLGAAGYYTRSSLTTISTTMTVEFWMRRESAANYDILFDFPTTGNITTSRFVLNPSSVGNSCYMEGTTSGAVYFASGGVATRCPTLNQFTHVAITANSTAYSLYYDGVLVGTCTYASPANASAARTWTLAALGVSTPLFAGRIFDVRLWSTVRTAAEIVANMKVQIVAQTGLAGYWQLNNSATDSSGNGNNFTAGGTVAYRPLNGFDVYLFNASDVRQSGNVRCNWMGA